MVTHSALGVLVVVEAIGMLMDGLYRCCDS
jgi:hypothetical protein